MSKKKLNCWEFMKCGKGPDRDKADQSGVCPVASEASADGLNNGVNGGRLCWVLAELYGDGKGKWRCSNVSRKSPCFSCEFRYKVTNEEGLIEVCKATGEFLAQHSKRKKKTS